MDGRSPLGHVSSPCSSHQLRRRHGWRRCVLRVVSKCNTGQATNNTKLEVPTTSSCMPTQQAMSRATSFMVNSAADPFIDAWQSEHPPPLTRANTRCSPLKPRSVWLMPIDLNEFPVGLVERGPPVSVPARHFASAHASQQPAAASTPSAVWLPRRRFPDAMQARLGSRGVTGCCCAAAQHLTRVGVASNPRPLAAETQARP